MKKPSVSVLSLIVLVALIAIPVCAAAPAEQEIPILEITGISLDPPDPYPDQENVKVTVECKNLSGQPVAEATYRVEIKTADDEPALVNTPQNKTIGFPEGGLAPSASSSFTTSFDAPINEGTYSLAVVLIAGNAQSTNSTTFVVESALPAEVTRLFATLGMFIGMMAIMAAGTEALLATLRLPLGIKHQTSAMEAFDKLKSELPGKLASVGVGQASLDAFEARCSEVRNVLGTIIGRMDAIHEAYAALRQGELKEAYDALKGLNKGGAKAAVQHVLQTLEEVPHLKISLPPLAVQGIYAAIDIATTQNALTQAGRMIQEIEKAVAEEGLAEKWLQSQVDSLLTAATGRTQDTIDQAIEDLQDLGFRPAFISKLIEPLSEALETAVDVAQDMSATYIVSLRNLLNGVRELRRVGRREWSGIVCWGWPYGGITLAAAGGFLGILSLILAGVPGKSFLGSPPIVGLGLAGILLAGASLWAYAGLRQSSADKDVEVHVTTAARALLEQEAQHQREESFRVGVLKLISLFIGVFLAYKLRVDAIELLDGILSPQVIDRINIIVIPQWEGASGQFHAAALTAGLILTGLAATAGSNFWHDQLDRLQNLKKQAEQSAKVVKNLKGMVVTPGDEQ